MDGPLTQPREDVPSLPNEADRPELDADGQAEVSAQRRRARLREPGRETMRQTLGP